MYNFYSAQIITPREKRYMYRCEKKRIEEQKEEREKRYERRNEQKKNENEKNEKSHNMILRPRIYYFLSFFGY